MEFIETNMHMCIKEQNQQLFWAFGFCKKTVIAPFIRAHVSEIDFISLN